MFDGCRGFHFRRRELQKMLTLVRQIRDFSAIGTKRLCTLLFRQRLLRLVSLFLLAIFCSPFITACSDDRIPSTINQLEGNLLIWHSLEPEIAELLKNGFRDFEHLNPGVKIQSVYVPGANIIPQFIEQSQRGFGASAIIDYTRGLSDLIKSQRIQPIIDSNINENIYYPTTLNQVSYRDTIYGIPLSSDTKVLCYNQAKLEVNSDPILSQPPTTLEELIRRAKKGYSVGMVSDFENTVWGIGNFGGSLFNAEGQIDVQLEGWSQWLRWLKKAITQPNFIMIRANYRIVNQAFKEGELAYYVCNASEVADLKKTMKDDFKVALLPNNASFTATPILYTRALMINRSASDNERQLAIALGEFLSNPEHQLEGIVQSQSFIPTNRQVILDKSLLPIESILLEQAKTAIAIPLDYLEQLLPTFEHAETLYQAAISGAISSKKATQELTQSIERELGR